MEIVEINSNPWFWKKIQTAGPSASAFSRAQHCLNLYNYVMFLCFGLFPESALGDGPKNHE